VIVSLVAVPLTVLIGSWAGYAIVASSPRTRRFLIVLTVVALMIPTGVLLIPRFVLFRWVGIIDSLWALMAPALMATSPFFVLIFAFVYSRIPRELFEAARLEGLSELGVWRRVAWPLGKPAAFAVAVLAFVFHWSNFVEAVLYISARELYTIPLGLRLLHTLEPALLSLLLTGAVIASVPPVVAFLAAQRALFTRTLEGR
jgi:multiple sugar transport system permease protein